MESKFDQNAILSVVPPPVVPPVVVLVPPPPPVVVVERPVVVVLRPAVPCGPARGRAPGGCSASRRAPGRGAARRAGCSASRACRAPRGAGGSTCRGGRTAGRSRAAAGRRPGRLVGRSSPATDHDDRGRKRKPIWPSSIHLYSPGRPAYGSDATIPPERSMPSERSNLCFVWRR